MAEAALQLIPSPGPPETSALRAVPAPPKSPKPRLDLAPYDLAAALALERELGVGHVLAQVLVRRGLADPAAAQRFLDAREAHDPGAFDGTERALAPIRAHIAAGRLIVVH